MCYKTARGIVPPRAQSLIITCVSNEPGREMGSSHLQTFITVSVYNSGDALCRVGAVGVGGLRKHMSLIFKLL